MTELAIGFTLGFLAAGIIFAVVAFSASRWFMEGFRRGFHRGYAEALEEDTEMEALRRVK